VLGDLRFANKSMKRWPLFWAVLKVPLDFSMLAAAGMAAYLLRISPWVAEWRPVLFMLELPLKSYILLVLGLSAGGILLFALAGLYAIAPSRRGARQVLDVGIVVSAGFMLLILYIFIRGELFNSRFIFLSGWIFAIIFVSAGRIILYVLERTLLVRRGLGSRRVLVVGNDAITERVIAFTKANPAAGYRVLKVLAEPNIGEVRAAIGNPGIEEVMLADPDYPREKVIELIDCCSDLGLGFQFVPNLFQTLTANVGMGLFGDVPLIELKRTRLEGWGRVAKRLMDVVGSVTIGILLLPIFAVTAFFIKWDSAGPVLVKLKRISQGREFELFKFRSMFKNTHHLKYTVMRHLNERADSPLFKLRNDPRVTRVGRFIRKTRLDEFPQLLNVLLGEMSLVGPRPHEPEEVARYEKHHKKVLAIKPGITGLPQVSGASDLPFEDEVRLDTYYIEQWSLPMDFKILLKTLLIVLRGDQSAV
jgi:exopolysaccharide biosynthesis polyprenyl glycosylphosphotransferase